MRGLTLLGVVVLTASAGCASNRAPERSFATRAEAVAAGAFDEGGLPEAIVPASARDIRERRDLRTGEIWVRFEFDEADRGRLLARCEPDASLRLPGDVTRGIGWWPALLRADPAEAREHFVLATCRAGALAGTAHLAVHRSLGTGFYWRRAHR